MSIQRVSSSSFSRRKYDVFLSFRGEDTRKNFTDHLYAALARQGVHVFRDDKELKRGKTISTELLLAIEESRFSIVVFSRNYASSNWCLDEIVKIVECKNTKGQNVIPIFYDVAPSVVRNQTGVFQEAFAEHEEKFKENNKKIQEWRNALREVANLSGWHAENRHESEFIQDIVQEISTKLRPTTLMNFDGLVGINSRLEKLKLLIGTGSNDVRMIGIWGMGGIGKTTIARAFYDLVSNQFEGSCFLANVQEISERNGDLVTLQRQLLYEILGGQENNIYNEYDGVNKIKNGLWHKKVLVVIDDVVCIEQLNKLAGKHDWFGLGSRIIITTRDKHLLLTHEVDNVYEAKELNDDESFQLLILRAFKNHHPPEDYRKLSELVVRYVGGLPLALEVLGSFLFGRTIDEWKDAIKRLKRDSDKGILDKLEIGFDGLKETEKKIFLDVACFFKGKEREYVTRILDGCNFNQTIGISVLLDKSLITISSFNELRMHDLLQEMGRQIVKRESIGEPGKRSRLWDEDDIRHVLTKNTGTKRVEAIILEKELHLSVGAKVFSKMINLRILKICKVQVPDGLEYLSNELRLLDWDGYSFKSLPSNLQLDKLVEFKMKCSSIEQLWEGIKPFNMLKYISFEKCKNLTKTPDFTGIPNLEKLILRTCSRLSEIHPSLLVHKKIKWMDLSYCSRLTTLPSEIHMESLERLKLSCSSNLKKFPNITGSMECLGLLDLEFTAIKELPLSIELLSGLWRLNLDRCENLLSLPSTINGLRSLKILSIRRCSKLASLPSIIDGLKSLERLEISGCSKLKKFPNITGSMKCLRRLDLNETAIKELPLSIELLVRLTDLNLDGCKNLSSLPSSINGLRSLETLSICFCSKLASLPSSIDGLKSLRTLNLTNCSKLVSLPSTINGLESLIYLDLTNCSKLVSLPSTINGLESLGTLCLSGCSKLENVPETLAQVERLSILNLRRTAIRQPMSSIFIMKNLEELNFHGCEGLSLKSLLEKSSNPLASTLPSLSGNLCSLTSLDLSYCNLGEGAIPDDFLGSLISLQKLYLSGNNFVSLPATIIHLSNLRFLVLKYCTSLQILPELPSNICYLYLDNCVSLETLPNALILRGWSHSEISCQNCLKLLNGSRVAFSMLQEYLKVVRKPSDTKFNFEAIVPGSEFPEWFKHKSEGTSMNIEKPPYLHNNSKLVGYIACCVFIVHTADQYLNRLNKNSGPVFIMLRGSNGGVSFPFLIDSHIYYEDGLSSKDLLDHLWLCYVSDPFLLKREGATKFSICSWNNKRMEAKRCGFHPVYEHEDYNELIQDFVGSITEVKSRAKNLHLKKVKRKIEQMWRSKGLHL